MERHQTEIKTRVVKLAELVPDPTNTRQHPQRSKQAIASSVATYGAARSIVVDARGVVRAGNGTLEAAKAAGITDAVLIETNGSQLVVVQRPDWTPAQALAYAIADNRTGELSEFDKEALGAALSSLVRLANETQTPELVGSIGFSDEELRGLLSVSPGGPETEPVFPDPKPASGNPETRYYVLIPCNDEMAQKQWLERLVAEGVECRAMLG